MENVREYLRFYIGQKCLMGDAVQQNSAVTLTGTDCDKLWHHETRIMLILRDIKTITSAEMKAIYAIIFKRPFHSTGHIIYRIDEHFNCTERWIMTTGVDRLGIEIDGHVWADCDLHHYRHNQHEVTKYLLDNGFDLFNLIPAGLAVADENFKPTMLPKQTAKQKAEELMDAGKLPDMNLKQAINHVKEKYNTCYIE